MKELVNTTLLGLFFGTFGTTIGGILGITVKKATNKFLSFILSFAAGLMLAVACFDLIPEAMKMTGIVRIILGIVLGIISMILCEDLINKKFNKTEKIFFTKNTIDDNKKGLLRTGIVTSIGIALHNFPEGLAIGSGFGVSTTLGYSLAIAICIHDIPEGISMAIPMKNGGMNKGRVLVYVILSGITTGIGAFFGNIIGDISEGIIALCLAYAAGAMLYIVSGELIPESNKLYSGRISTIGNIIGFIIGLIAVSF